jgi:hypothetical protein
LQALPEFEISAVCTTRQDSAEAAARHFGVPLASPGFDAAVMRHRLLSAIERASDTGEKQVIRTA